MATVIIQEFNIAPGITLKQNGNGKDQILEFSIIHSRWDRLNMCLFPFIILTVTSMFFLLFIGGLIHAVIYPASDGSFDVSIVWIEGTLFLVMALCVFWMGRTLSKIPKSELLTVSGNGLTLKLENHRFSVKEYDLTAIKGVWLYEYFVNGTMMSIYGVLSQTPGDKKIRDDSPLLVLPISMSTSRKLEAIYRVILLYMQNRFPHVQVGYDSSVKWAHLLEIFG